MTNLFYIFVYTENYIKTLKLQINKCENSKFKFGQIHNIIFDSQTHNK